MSNKRKICCERLEGLYFVSQTKGINCRVIRNSDDFIRKSKTRGFIEKRKMKYLLTDGYTGKLSSDSTKVLFINYCPFCGKKLTLVFKNDSQINEDNHDW
jgi:hypothetical protein